MTISACFVSVFGVSGSFSIIASKERYFSAAASAEAVSVMLSRVRFMASVTSRRVRGCLSEHPEKAPEKSNVQMSAQ